MKISTLYYVALYVSHFSVSSEEGVTLAHRVLILKQCSPCKSPAERRRRRREGGSGGGGEQREREEEEEILFRLLMQKKCVLSQRLLFIVTMEVRSTMEPLNNGQVGDERFVHCSLLRR